MKRVLVDTGPLVALVDSRDRLHERAMEEVDRLVGPLWVGLPVLTEACFLLGSAHLRKRLAGVLEREVMQLAAPKDAEGATHRSMQWLERYAEHSPDFADAFLVCWAESDASLAVWTFDREFSTLWRTLSGKKVRLAVD